MKYIFLSFFLCLTPLFGTQNVVVVLDDSGSMNDKMKDGTVKLAAAKQALIKVLSRLEPSDNLGILLLNKGWLVKLGPLDKEYMVKKVSSFSAGGPTPLSGAMKKGTDDLLNLRGKIHYGTYKLLVVTDGVANSPELVNTYVQDIMSRGIAVDVIGVAMAQRHSLATKVHTYRKADDPASLEKAVSMVFGEIVSRDTGDNSDFEMLEGFPNELAAACLAALSEERNHPIGTEVRKAEPKAVSTPVKQPANNSSNASPSSNTSVTVEDNSGSSIGIGWLPVIVIFIAVIAAVSKKK